MNKYRNKPTTVDNVRFDSKLASHAALCYNKPINIVAPAVLQTPKGRINLSWRFIMDSLYPHADNGNPPQRQCTKCNQWKPLDDFYWDKRFTNRVTYAACKSCVSARRKGNYKPSRRVANNTFIDRIGQRYGKLVILSYAGIGTYGKRNWECQCDCGNKTIVGYSTLVSGSTKSCGCSRRGKRNTPSPTRKSFGESSFNMLYAHYKKNCAKERGYPFELDKNQFRILTQSACFYCGQPPSQEGPTAKGSYGAYIYTGIDRIDNTLGYILGNVRPCCKQCNFAKGALSEQEFLDWLQRIAKKMSLGGYK